MFESEGIVMNTSTQTPAQPAAVPVPRRSLPSAATVPSNPSKRARRDRCPNWLPQEITALVNAKREMFLEEIEVVDARDLMNPDSNKWLRVSQEVMKSGFSPCQRDGAACKTKWNQIVPDYKRIADYFSRTGTNGADYWDMSASDRKNEGLPRSFPQDIFFNLQGWFGTRPSIQPPHTRDLLSPDDRNYTPQAPSAAENDAGWDSEAETEDPVDTATHAEGTDDTSGQTPAAPQGRSTAMPSESPVFLRHGIRSPLLRTGLPVGVTPHLISSSDTSDSNARKRLGNTAVRRKSISGHSLIAQATKASGDVMAGQMREMAEASRDLERSKIEVQLKLFSEQMQFQREKDRRLHESSCIANENAKLAIEKQGEVVKCLAQ